MLFRDDMIDLTAEIGVILMDQAVFAQMIRPRLDKSAQAGINIAGHCEQSV